VGAEGVLGIAVLTITAKVCALLVPQELLAATVILPLIADPDVETIIEVLPCPEVIFHPAGADHV
jgi:hypothetical protein